MHADVVSWANQSCISVPACKRAHVHMHACAADFIEIPVDKLTIVIHQQNIGYLVLSALKLAKHNA